MTPSHHYASTAQRIERLVSAADPAIMVPACPAWTVRDLLAHVVGLSHDIATGALDGYASPRWTTRQIEERAGRTTAQLLDEWAADRERVSIVLDDIEQDWIPELIETALGTLPRTMFRAAFVIDLVQHEHDLRGALGSPRDPNESDRFVLGHVANNLSNIWALQQLPGLELHDLDHGDVIRLGTTTGATVAASCLDLLRMLGGRRTRAEIAALDWSGEATEVAQAHVVLPFFEPPVTPVRGG